MRVINQLSLPQALVDASTENVAPSERRHGADISVTELIGPPRIKQLKDACWHLMETDVSDLAFSMMGNGFHERISRHARGLSEMRFTITRMGFDRQWTISGAIDLIEEGVLWDFKTCRSAAVADNRVKPDWEAQVNIYRMMAEEHSIPIGAQYILAAVRDYTAADRFSVQKGRAQYPYVKLSVPRWKTAAIEAYIQGRLTEHESTMPLCTPDERWSKGEEHAVYLGEDPKRAFRVCSTRKDAEFVRDTLMAEWGQNKAKAKRIIIRKREPECLRCKFYCDVSKFCDYGRKQRGLEVKEADDCPY